MKLEKLNDDNLIVFLSKIYIDKHKISFNNDLEDNFKLIFKTLGSYYDIDMFGYYNITVYQDSIYGVVLCIKRENIDFYNYYDDHIDMKISIIKNKFVFKLNDNSIINEKVLKFTYLIIYNGGIYIIPKKTINDYDMGYILENSKLIFGAEATTVLDRCRYINTSKVFI